MSWHITFLKIAQEIAKHSKDQDRKVGCIVVKDNRIISLGYNGTPHSFDNNCKDKNGKTKPEVIHAESNAITKCAKSTESIAGATMYSTLACCVECAKLIIQCEIAEFVFAEAWKNDDGLKLLVKAGVLVKGMMLGELCDFSPNSQM
jgi:dCMP deaminase